MAHFLLGQAEIIPKSHLSCPAFINDRFNVIVSPFNDLLKLIPVVNGFKRQTFNWRSRNDQTVRTSLTNLLQTDIVLLDSFTTGMPKMMSSRIQERHRAVDASLVKTLQKLP